MIHAALAVVSDSPGDAASTAALLAAAGIPSNEVPSAAVLARLKHDPPPLVLVVSGGKLVEGALRLVREIRTLSEVPLVLEMRGTADEQQARLKGFTFGADDCIPENATGPEVIARIRAVLRRSGIDIERRRVPRPTTPLPPGGLVGEQRFWRLSANRRDLFRPDGEPLGLTCAEFDFLALIAANARTPTSREALSQQLFRRPWYPDDRAVDNVAARLRRKLNANGVAGNPIKPVRAVGYVFAGF